MQFPSMVTNTFLSQALGQSVDSFTIEQIGEGEGYMADLYRLSLTGPADPTTIIMKLASQDQEKRQLAIRFGSYHRESRFYQSLADECPVRTPHCYYNSEGEFLLLLEDLGDWPVIEAGGGASLRQASLAIQTLATLHGARWQVPPPVNGFGEGFRVAAEDMASFVTDRLNELPSSDAVDFMRHYAADSLTYLPLFEEQHQVFSHLDYRLDNLRISDQAVAVFDWGDSCLGPPGFDLAYFMVTSIDKHHRTAWEATLLNTYREALVRQGISYTPDSLLDSYRLAIPPSFYLAALVLTRGDRDYGQRLAHRCLAAITDHLPFLRTVFN